MATTTMGSAGTHRETLTNPTYWLILVALVILIAVGYSTRTTTTDTLSASTERVPATDVRLNKPIDNRNTYPMNNMGLPLQENSKNNLNRINESGAGNPNSTPVPATRN